MILYCNPSWKSIFFFYKPDGMFSCTDNPAISTWVNPGKCERLGINQLLDNYAACIATSKDSAYTTKVIGEYLEYLADTPEHLRITI